MTGRTRPETARDKSLGDHEPAIADGGRGFAHLIHVQEQDSDQHLVIRTALLLGDLVPHRLDGSEVEGSREGGVWILAHAGGEHARRHGHRRQHERRLGVGVRVQGAQVLEEVAAGEGISDSEDVGVEEVG